MPTLSNDNPPNLTYFYCSSKDRIAKTDRSFTTNFVVEGPTVQRPKKIILNRICFVNTLYNVNENNCKLALGTWDNTKSLADQVKSVINITGDATSADSIVNGDPGLGFYTIDTFIPKFQAALRAFYAANDIVVGWDTTTYMITVTSPTKQPVFYGSTYGTTCNTVVGFDDRYEAVGRGYPSDSFGTGNISRFGNTFNLLGYNTLFLCSEYLSAGTTVITSSPGIANVVSMVPLSGYAFGQIVEFSPGHVYDWEKAGNIDFRLVDDLGRTVNLNGGDLNITIAIITEEETNTYGKYAY